MVGPIATGKRTGRVYSSNSTVNNRHFQKNATGSVGAGEARRGDQGAWRYDGLGSYMAGTVVAEGSNVTQRALHQSRTIPADVRHIDQ